MASSPDRDKQAVADQPGASPPAQPIPPASSSQHPALPSSMPLLPLQDQWEPQPYMDLSLLELNSNHAIDASLSDMIRYISVPPPQAAPEAPFAEPAIPPPPPPEMYPPMQTQHFNQGPPIMETMQGSQYDGYPGAAWTQDAAHYTLPPDAPLPPEGPAVGRRRGRPPGSTAKPKPKLAKTAVESACQLTAATSSEEWPTSEQPAAGNTSATIARNACEMEELQEEAVGAASEGVEQEEVKYAETSSPGIRFKPSDAEIIGYLSWKYLGRSMPVPVDFIKDFNVFQDHPSLIQEKLGKSTNGSWYVFSPRNRKYPNGFRPNRSVGAVGYWKSNTEEAPVTVKGVEIGKVNSLTFMLGRQPKGDKTTWKLKEYRIQKYQLQPPSTLLDRWVICKLFNTEDQDDDSVQDETDDESDEHIDVANGSGGEDNVDGNPPPNEPEDELDIDEYLALDDFEHGDPADQ